MDHKELFAECRSRIAKLQSTGDYKRFISHLDDTWKKLEPKDREIFIGEYLPYLESGLAGKAHDIDRCYRFYTDESEPFVDTPGLHLSKGLWVFYQRKGVTKKNLPNVYERLESSHIRGSTSLKIEGLQDRSVEVFLRKLHEFTEGSVRHLSIKFDGKFHEKKPEVLGKTLDLILELWGAQLELLMLSMDGRTSAKDEHREGLFASLTAHLPKMSKLEELILGDTGDYKREQLVGMLDAAPASLTKLTLPNHFLIYNSPPEASIIDALFEHPIMDRLTALRPQIAVFDAEVKARLAARETPETLRHLDLEGRYPFAHGYPSWGDPDADFEADLKQKLVKEDHEISPNGALTKRISLSQCDTAKLGAVLCRRAEEHAPIVYERLDDLSLRGVDAHGLMRVFTEGPVCFPRASALSLDIEDDGEFEPNAPEVPTWSSLERLNLEAGLRHIWNLSFTKDVVFPNVRDLRVTKCTQAFASKMIEHYDHLFPALKKLDYSFLEASDPDGSLQLQTYLLLIEAGFTDKLDSLYSYLNANRCSEEVLAGWVGVMKDEAIPEEWRRLVGQGIFSYASKETLTRVATALELGPKSRWTKQDLCNAIKPALPACVHAQIYPQ